MLTRISLNWWNPAEHDPEDIESLPGFLGTADPSILEAEEVAGHEDAVAVVWRHVYLVEGAVVTKYSGEVYGGDVVHYWSEDSPDFDTVDEAKDWAEVALGIIFAPDPSEWGGPDNSTGEEYVPPVEELPEEPF